MMTTQQLLRTIALLGLLISIQCKKAETEPIVEPPVIPELPPKPTLVDSLLGTFSSNVYLYTIDLAVGPSSEKWDTIFNYPCTVKRPDTAAYIYMDCYGKYPGYEYLPLNTRVDTIIGYQYWIGSRMWDIKIDFPERTVTHLGARMDVGGSHYYTTKAVWHF